MGFVSFFGWSNIHTYIRTFIHSYRHIYIYIYAHLDLYFYGYDMTSCLLESESFLLVSAHSCLPFTQLLHGKQFFGLEFPGF